MLTMIAMIARKTLTQTRPHRGAFLRFLVVCILVPMELILGADYLRTLLRVVAVSDNL